MATPKATIHNTSDGSSVIAFGDGSFTVASSPEELELEIQPEHRTRR